MLPTLHHANVDPVVNANVLAYLGEREETAQAVGYVVAALGSSPPERSAYHPDDCSLYHAASRALFLGVRSLEEATPRIVEALESRYRQGSLGTPLLAAQAAISLINLREWREFGDGVLSDVMGAQQQDGGWASYPAYLGPAPYYGSRALTTAYCIEALARRRAMVVDEAGET